MHSDVLIGRVTNCIEPALSKSIARPICLATELAAEQVTDESLHNLP